MQQEVYLIYDIGKTNKKCLVFSLEGKVVDEYMEVFTEITDEDGFPCDDLVKLEEWITGQYELLLKNSRYKIIGINFATYGASFVHIDKDGKPLTALYNYLKPYPTEILNQFLQTYFSNDTNIFALETASPTMGMLNSGLQLYWLKHTQPDTWQQIAYSLHLPQYLSYLFTQSPCSDYTSIGCHTGIWDFKNNTYQQWIIKEGIDRKLAPIQKNAIINTDKIFIGTGLHDSSAALIPYLEQHQEPFLLISSGTWCINLNPFNQQHLTVEELKMDVLNFLQFHGVSVKASRIFLGREHDFQAARIATHFNTPNDFYKTVKPTEHIDTDNHFIPACMEGSGPSPEKQDTIWNIEVYKTAAEAYTALLYGLVSLLKLSIDLIDTNTVKDFYIDGGFAANPLFFSYLQQHYPHKKITAVAFPQATALGAYLQLKQLTKQLT
jgi:sugar (pentulose or hexulose) kinase